MHPSQRLTGKIARTPTSFLSRIASMLDAAWCWAGRTARRAHEGWTRRGAARATYLALSQLDDWVLRDMGIDRSEIMSVAVETSGRIASTRVPRACGVHAASTSETCGAFG